MGNSFMRRRNGLDPQGIGAGEGAGGRGRPIGPYELPPSQAGPVGPSSIIEGTAGDETIGDESINPGRRPITPAPGGLEESIVPGVRPDSPVQPGGIEFNPLNRGEGGPLALRGREGGFIPSAAENRQTPVAKRRGFISPLNKGAGGYVADNASAATALEGIRAATEAFENPTAPKPANLAPTSTPTPTPTSTSGRPNRGDYGRGRRGNKAYRAAKEEHKWKKRKS